MRKLLKPQRSKNVTPFPNPPLSCLQVGNPCTKKPVEQAVLNVEHLVQQCARDFVHEKVGEHKDMIVVGTTMQEM